MIVKRCARRRSASFAFAAKSAPTIVMPEIAFAPDISGVWSVGGTLVITSKPTNMARTNT